MKDLMVIIGTIILGAIIFNMMIGPGDDSFKSHARAAMVKSTMSFQEQYE